MYYSFYDGKLVGAHWHEPAVSPNIYVYETKGKKWWRGGCNTASTPQIYLDWVTIYEQAGEDIELEKERLVTLSSQHELGAKLDNGKPRLDMVLGNFANALLQVGGVGTFGAEKYTDGGWLHVPNGIERYSDAMLRHYMEEAKGDEMDKESGYLHAAHIAWNALARLELMLLNKG